jgi:hypothetical protein
MAGTIDYEPRKRSTLICEGCGSDEMKIIPHDEEAQAVVWN